MPTIAFRQPKTGDQPFAISDRVDWPAAIGNRASADLPPPPFHGTEIQTIGDEASDAPAQHRRYSGRANGPFDNGQFRYVLPFSKMPRLRYLIDILVVAIASFAFDAAADLLPLPDNFRIGIVVSTVAKCLFLLFICFWLRRRGNNVITIGLTRPRSWTISILGGITVAAALFIAVYLLERAGFRRDLSAFAAFKGNRELTLYQLGGVIIGAGFGEEFVFRGFLFHRLAMLFGGSKAAWGIGCVVQAIMFGLLHTYQGPMGVLLTGSIGFINGIVFLANGRNLWMPIFAHALYDAARIFAFYLHGLPPW